MKLGCSFMIVTGILLSLILGGCSGAGSQTTSNYSSKELNSDMNITIESSAETSSIETSSVSHDVSIGQTSSSASGFF